MKPTLLVLLTLADSSGAAIESSRVVQSGLFPAHWTPTSDTLELHPEHERILEEVVELEEDAADLTERLQEDASWRVDLTSASESALYSIPNITTESAAALVAFRRRGGRLQSEEDLRRAGLSREAIHSILPYVALERRNRQVRLEIIQRWTRRLDLGRGYERDSTRQHYLGTPDVLYTRVRLQIGDRLTLGGTLDKDAGERFLWWPRGRQLGFDFAGGYVAVEPIGPISHLIVGDFSIDLSEGLLFGQSRSRASSLGWSREPNRVRFHSSSREYGFFRGVAAESRAWRGWSLVAFASRRSIDGRVDSSSSAAASTGLHRTESELTRRGRIRERAIGAGVLYRRGILEAGMTGTWTAHSFSSFRMGHRGFSVFAAFTKGPLRLSFETARRDAAPAVSGSLRYVGPVGRIWIRFVDTFPGGRSTHTSTGVDGAGRTRRELSYEGGVRIRPAEQVVGTLFSRWRRRTPASLVPTWTMHAVASIDIHPRSWLRLHLRLSEKRTESEGTCPRAGGEIRCAIPALTRALRIQAEYDHSRALRTRLRVETAVHGGGPGSHFVRGTLVFEDFRWQLHPGLRIDARLALFDVDSHGARLYAVENDLLYSFSATQFSGRGVRRYVVAQLGPFGSLVVQLKYGITTYEDVQSVGSGLDETDGQRLRDLRVQLRVRLG